ncbi:MAG: AAA family ATPase [Clostridia bacterium]|nr:AAA family ATPase [Clostridia bacterium]
MKDHIKELINIVYKMCDAYDDLLKLLEANIIDDPLREALRLELVMYISHLSKSDGTITQEEVDFLNVYLDNNFNAEFYERFIKEVYFDILTDVPPTIKLLVIYDNIVYKHTDNVKSLAGTTAQLFYYLGKELLACDNEITHDEICVFTSSISRIIYYINNNLDYWYDIDIDFCAEENYSFEDEESEDNQIIEREQTLNQLLEELDSLIGLKSVKNDVKSLINLLQIRKIREEKGLKTFPLSLHLVFYGNPGTGKTTVARLLSRIYRELGLLSKGHLVEVDRSGLVGGYVGQTALKVKETINKAKGGVLFIDEAYSLTANKGDSDYGIEAVETLLKEMEDNRNDLVVIVAGYPKLMEEFLKSNPGLKSRFNKFILFDDYNEEELLAIFKKFCDDTGYSLASNCEVFLKKYFIDICSNKEESFSNARFVRNLFEKAVTKQANRLVNNQNLTEENISIITVDDIL